jgi:hypothetical protein
LEAEKMGSNAEVENISTMADVDIVGASLDAVRRRGDPLN